MGIYYRNILYYGRILSGKSFINFPEIINRNTCIYKVNSDRYIVYDRSKFVFCDDGITDIKLVPDYINKEVILKVNKNIDTSFFNINTDNKNDLVNLFKCISNPLSNNLEPSFYICCFQFDTYEITEDSCVLYNIIVN